MKNKITKNVFFALILSFTNLLNAQETTSNKIDSSNSMDEDTTITISKEIANNVLKYYIPSYNIGKNRGQIATDRPHQTETAEIVPYNTFQVETGFTYEQDKYDEFKNQNIVYNSCLLKFGLGSGMDFRFGFDVLTNKVYKNDSLKNKNFGFSGLSFGGKKFLTKGTRFFPKTSLMAELYLPYFGNQQFRPSYTGGTIRFLCEHEIGDKLEWEYNIGPDWDGNSPNVNYFFATSLTYNLLGPLSIYGELYGFFTERKKQEMDLILSNGFYNDIRCDGGFVYLINDDFQLDLEGGLAITKSSPDYFVSFGLSYRVSKN
jgi:hypothetical protein